ncbi:mycothiol transferase [Pseudactinotalea sp. Z1732]|uniref:mycothiol transferase n=1 Tax=Micrococcales TaxID=85006 RepID=UPI003C7DD05E
MTEHARAMLTDHFGRIDELVEDLTDGLSPETSRWRPAADANTIAWLLWHQSRVQDDHVSDLAGTEQVWPQWHERLDLPLDVSDTGFGHSPDDVAAVRISAADLRDYHAQVHARTLEYVGRLDGDELERVVNSDWDPPVTVAIRLVSVIGDCLQHLGQAAYIRGIAPAG